MRRRHKRPKETDTRPEPRQEVVSFSGPGKSREAEIAAVAKRHLRFGWWSLLCFLSLGMLLESLHGFKVEWYVDVSNTTRRHMWTLAHAHGTLLAVLNLVLGGTVHLLTSWTHRSRALASACLLSAALLLPGGFFLGGLYVYAGDPGFGILLVPLGALLLITAVFLAARSTRS